MLEDLRIWLDLAHQMRDKVTIERLSQSAILNQLRPMQCVGIAEGGALVPPRNPVDKIERAWEQTRGPANELLQERLPSDRQRHLRDESIGKYLWRNPACFKCPDHRRSQPHPP
jgi:hypothetical protein